MPKSKTFTQEDIERVRTMLTQAPEKPAAPAPLTAREMVIAMKAEILDLQKRAYTLEEISEMIRGGFNLDKLGASTIKQYLQKKRATSKTPKAPIKS